MRDTAVREIELADPGARCRGSGPRGEHGLRRRRDAHDAAGRRPGPDAGRGPVELGAGAGRGGHDRGEPRLGDGGLARRARRGRLHAGVVRDAVRRAARAGDPGPDPRPGQGARRGALGPRCRPRRLSRPDLRHAGGVRRGLAAVGRRRRWTPGSSTSRPTRWWSRTAPGWPARSGAASWPLRTRTTRPPSTRSPTTCCRRPDLDWYEVSNWARPGAQSRHNQAYWRGADWWGVGPGAHSHVGGPDASVRWWNVKHPRAYAQRLADGRSPAAGREVLDAKDVALERVLLGVRVREGLAVSGPGGGRQACGRRSGGRRPGGRRGRGARPGGADQAGPAAGRRGGAGADLTSGRGLPTEAGCCSAGTTPAVAPEAACGSRSTT